MSFLDTIKDRLRGGDDDYYEDDYYDEGYEDDGYEGERGGRHEAHQGGGLLGNTPRPEAESVSVYTRSGRPVGGRDHGVSSRSYSDPTPVMPVAGGRGGYDAQSPAQQTTDLSGRGAMRVSSGQLPPYVLRPVAYDDVQTVVRRVKTNQPVVLVFRNTDIECAKRILDFCFGFSYGVDGEVSELGDRVFAVLPQGVTLTATDLDKLAADGDLVR